MVALLIGVMAVLAVATSATAVIRLVLQDGYGPVATRDDYDTRRPSLSRT